MGFMEKIQWNHLIQTTVGIGVAALTGACCSRLVAPLSKTEGALIPLVGIIAKEVLVLKKDLNIPTQALITFSATFVAILPYRFSKGAKLQITQPVFVFCVAVTAANTVVKFCIAKFDFFKDSKVSTKTENTPLPSKTENTLLPGQILKNFDESRYNAAKNEIMDSKPTDPSKSHFGTIQCSTGPCCDLIFPGIYLGDASAAVDLIKPGALGAAPSDFLTDVKCIISLCPISDMCADVFDTNVRAMNETQKLDYYGLTLEDYRNNEIFDAKEKEKRADYAEEFEKLLFPNWLRLGQDLEDHLDSWDLLVERNSKSEHKKSKKHEDYFSESFALLDQAFLSKEAVLVHCRWGQSRSSTLIIAWLISRFEVTAEQAQYFLRSKRPSVQSKFMGKLQEYETNLMAERATKSPG